MSRFNNVQTSDGYSPAATIENVHGGVQVSLHVFNKAIVYQLATGYPGGSWGAERYLAPGFHVLARHVSGVRVRSAVAGQPAQVTAEVASDEEVSWGDTPPGDFHGNHTLTVDAQGNPTYDFDGHVSAQGLDLETHEDISEPLPHSTIRWLLEADGSLVAQLWGVLEGTSRELRLRGGDSVAGPEIQLKGDPAAIRASIFFARRTIFDGDGASGFLQVIGNGDHAGTQFQPDPVDWRLHLGMTTFDGPSVPANANALWAITGWTDLAGGASPGPQVGDFVLQAAPVGLPNGLVLANVHADVPAADTIRVNARNVTGAAVNPAAVDFRAAWIRGTNP